MSRQEASRSIPKCHMRHRGQRPKKMFFVTRFFAPFDRCTNKSFLGSCVQESFPKRFVSLLGLTPIPALSGAIAKPKMHRNNVQKAMLLRALASKATGGKLRAKQCHCTCPKKLQPFVRRKHGKEQRRAKPNVF